MRTKHNRVLCGLLAVVLLLTVIPFGAAAEESAEPDMTVIDSSEALMAFADAVNGGDSFEGKTVRLTVNIYLGGESNPWTPIGKTKTTAFKGTFDGGYHTVSGLYISASASGVAAGFFGYVGGTVQGLVVDGEVTCTNSISTVGGVVNYLLSGGKVLQCGNRAVITGGSGVGGVVGYANGACTVSGCFNTGAITGTTGYVGGIVGQTYGNGTVENCYNLGTVKGPATVGGVGGGFKRANTVFTACYNAGTVLDSAGYENNIGAVVGVTKGTVTGCYYLTTAEGVATDSKADGVTAITAAMMGDAYTDGETAPALKWEAGLSTDAPVYPAFSERTALSAELAALIRAAVNSVKTNGGIEGSLLGNAAYLAGASSTATDWMAIAMGRFGYLSFGEYVPMVQDGTGYGDYLASLRAYIEKTYAENGGLLHQTKATEWHRAILAIAALGGDPTAFGTYNGKPINLVADGCYQNALQEGPGTQGLNGWIWGLLALDAGNYEVPADAKYPRETFIREILKLQLTDGAMGNRYGGWVLGGFGSTSDVDMTAMAIQALAPYYNDDTVYTYVNENSGEEVSKTVRTCVDEALEVLGVMQNENGGFSSWGTDNAESVAQVLVALCSVGIDPATDARFRTGSGKTLLDGLMRFLTPSGGFGHVLNTGWNSMANDQATYALVSYWRFENGMRALYDMRAEADEETAAAVSAADAAIAAVAAPGSAGYKASLQAALTAFRAVPETERRYVRGYGSLAAAIEVVGGEAALETEAPYPIAISVVKTPDRTQYTEGELFDPAGLVVAVIWSDWHAEMTEDYLLSLSGKTELGTEAVTVRWGALQTSFAIEVLEWMPWEGTGSETDPYRIQDADGLRALAEKVNRGNFFTGVYFVLTADLDLSEYPDWEPIGISSKKQFDGMFDGQGHVIDNLYSTVGGLFGYVCKNAVIRNVGVASGEIRSERSWVGAIAGWSNGADFLNCWNGASVSGRGYSGGIVGTVRDGGESIIRGCYNIGDVTGTDLAIGGIVGHLDTDRNGTACHVTVSDCYNAGTVTAPDTVGGIAGKVQDGHVIRNCYNAGTVTATGSTALDGAGGIVGGITSDNTVTDCYYDSEKTEKGIANGSATATAKTAEEMQSAEFPALLGEGFRVDRYALENGGFPLLAWQKTPAADAVREAEALIDAIGTVTGESGDAIRAARAALEALDETQKALVGNADVLLRAEELWKNLQAGQVTEEPDRVVTGTQDSDGPIPLGCASSVGGGLWLVALLGVGALVGSQKRRH